MITYSSSNNYYRNNQHILTISNQSDQKEFIKICAPAFTDIKMEKRIVNL